MTINELMEKLIVICPEGELGEDNDGQLVWYTGLMLYGGENEKYKDEVIEYGD